MKCNIVTLASEYVFGSYLKESKHCIEFIGKNSKHRHVYGVLCHL